MKIVKRLEVQEEYKTAIESNCEIIYKKNFVLYFIGHTYLTYHFNSKINVLFISSIFLYS